MSLIFTIVCTAVGAGLGIELGRISRNNKKQDTEIRKERAVNQNQSPLLNALENIAYANELENFKLVKRDRRNGEAKFQYLYGGYLFTVLTELDLVSCKVEKDGTVLIDYVFDEGWDEYDKKVIVRSVLEEGPQQSVLNLLEDFMVEVNYYDWEGFEEDLVVIDDSKGGTFLTDSYVMEAIPEPVKPVSDIKELVLSEGRKGPIQEQFLNAIERVEEAGAKLMAFDMQMDVESRHIYEELIEKDIAKLFTAYTNLSDDKKESYEEKIVDGIERIDATTSNLLEQIEKRNVHEIESVLHVISERYEK